MKASLRSVSCASASLLLVLCLAPTGCGSAESVAAGPDDGLEVAPEEDVATGTDTGLPPDTAVDAKVDSGRVDTFVALDTAAVDTSDAVEDLGVDDLGVDSAVDIGADSSFDIGADLGSDTGSTDTGIKDVGADATDPCSGVTLTGSIFVTSVTDPDLVALQTAECVRGSIYIESVGGLTAVLLPKLRSVTGGIRITSNASLKSVSMPALVETGTDFLITNNPLTSLDLSAFTRSGGKLELKSLGNVTGGLTSISLPALLSVASTFTMQSNDNLTSFSAPLLATAGQIVFGGTAVKGTALNSMDLSGLKSVTTTFTLYYTQLPKIDLPSLTTLDGLDVTSNPAMLSFNAPKLSILKSNANLSNNYAMTSFDFSSLVVGPRFFLLSYNTKLLNLQGFRNLTTISDSLNMTGNDALVDLTGLGKLTTVASLSIAKFASLTSLNGLGPVSGGTISLAENPKLASLSALAGLKTVTNIAVTFSPLLTSLAGLESLTTVTNAAQFATLSGLTDVSALRNLTTVTRSLTFAYLPKVTSVDLPALTTAGSFDVTYSAAVTSIKAPLLTRLLSAGASSEGNLRINNNVSLTSFEFPALVRVDQQFQVQDNLKLPNCVATKLRDQVRAAEKIGGSSTIARNLADGCI